MTNEPLLKAGEVRKVGEAIAHCASCMSLVRLMKQIGLDTEELEKRHDDQSLLAQGMLEVNRLTGGEGV